jgi:uncharacterized protein YecE (DUF72 family)
MALFAGTSGWAYKEWKPAFYPPGLPQARWLEHYATVLPAVEINATFYRMQSPETIAKWRKAAPDSFRFATKIHRAITHARVLAPNDDRQAFIDNYFESISALGIALGPVLLQLPGGRTRDLESLRALIGALPKGILFAFDFTDESWNDIEVLNELASGGGTACYSDRNGDAPDSLPPGPIGYVRMRHPRYTDEQRERWRDLLDREAAGRDVYVFTKHEGVETEDSHGGVGLSLWLNEHA